MSSGTLFRRVGPLGPARGEPSGWSRRRLLQLGLAGGVAGLGAPARACEFFTGTLRVFHPWARATLEDETTARVFMKFDEVREDDRLIGVQTMLATGAEIAGPGVPRRDGVVDLPIPQGRTLELSEAGIHLRLLDLQWQLQVLRAYPMDLIFEKGGTIKATLSIDFPRAAS